MLKLYFVKSVACAEQSMKLLLFQLVLVVASQATFLQQDGRTIYKYQATVKNMVENPTPFTSEYEIVAIIYSQKDGGVNLFALHDIKISQYIGKHQPITSDNNNATTEQGNIQLPFEIHYLENGNIDYINVDGGDSTWSINLKKGIASLFQLDYSRIHKNRDEHKSGSFHSLEHTPMGQCSIINHVDSQHEGNLKITKTFDCVEKWIKHSSLMSPGLCEEPMDDPVKINRHRVYDLQYENNKYSINSIESDWNVLYYPIDGKGGSHSVSVKQSIQKSSEEINLTGQSITNPIKVHIQEANSNIDLVTALQGKTENTFICNLTHIKDTLEGMVEYMKNGHVNLQEPEWEKTNLYYSLMNSLRAMDLKCFHSLANHLNSTAIRTLNPEYYDLYMKILPFVGTHPSAIFMHEIVKHLQVDDSLAQTFYRDMPFNIMFPDDKLLAELSNVLTWDMKTNEEVTRSAILSFATILSKSNPIHAAQYVDKIIDELHSCQNYKCQMLFISALQNTQSNKVAETLNPVILNEFKNETITPNLRNLAMWAALHEHIRNPTILQKIYLPILIDTEESLELRANALKFLMTDMSMENLLKLNNLMKSEKNEHLYNIYYTSLRSLSRSVSPCYKTSRLQARNIIQYIKRTAQSSYESFNDVYDYYDESYNMGAISHVSVVGSFFNRRTISIYITFSTQLSNTIADQYSLYLKLQANEHVKKTIISVLKTVDMLSVTNLKNILTELEKMDPDLAKGFHVEMIIFKFNKIIEARTYSNVRVFAEDLRNIVRNREQETTYSISNAVEAISTISTDIGTPVITYFSLPTIQKMKIFFNKDNTINMKLELHGWNTQTYGIKTFNPIDNKWYGSRRYMQVDTRLPIHLQSKIEEGSMEVKLDLQNDDFFGKGDIGFQSFVQSQVYIYDEHKEETYEYYKPVTKGVKHQKQINLFDIDNEDTGMIYNISIFNCERNLSPSRLANIKNYITSEVNKNFGQNNILKYLLQARHLWAVVTLSADPGMCGFGIRGRRNSIQVTDISTTLGYKLLDTSLENDIIPVGTTAFYFKYNLKNEKDIIKSWDIEWLLKTVGESNPKNKFTITGTKRNKEDYNIIVNQRNIKDDKVLWDMSIKRHNSSQITELKVSVTSSLSDEQASQDIVYPECKDYGNMNKVACIAARTSLRHDDISIEYNNKDTQLQPYIEMLNDYMLTNYATYYKRNIPKENKLKDGEILLKVDYNVASEDMDIIINCPLNSYGYIGIPNNDDDLLQTILTPTTLTNDLEESYGGFVCEINCHYYVNQFNERIQHNITGDLTPFVELDFPKVIISIQNKNNRMLLQLDLLEDVVQVYSNEEEIKMLIYSQDPNNSSEQYVDYKMLQNEMLIRAPKLMGTVVLYGSHQVNIYSNRDPSATGLCFE